MTGKKLNSQIQCQSECRQRNHTQCTASSANCHGPHLDPFLTSVLSTPSTPTSYLFNPRRRGKDNIAYAHKGYRHHSKCPGCSSVRRYSKSTNSPSTVWRGLFHPRCHNNGECMPRRRVRSCCCSGAGASEGRFCNVRSGGGSS